MAYFYIIISMEEVWGEVVVVGREVVRGVIVRFVDQC